MTEVDSGVLRCAVNHHVAFMLSRCRNNRRVRVESSIPVTMTVGMAKMQTLRGCCYCRHIVERPLAPRIERPCSSCSFAHIRRSESRRCGGKAIPATCTCWICLPRSRQGYQSLLLGFASTRLACLTASPWGLRACRFHCSLATSLPTRSRQSWERSGRLNRRSAHVPSRLVGL